MDLTKEAYYQAITVLEKCSTQHGFHASSPGYQGVWARDSNIISLGASLLDNKFKDTFKNSLILLGKYQSPKGQIPNAVLLHDKPKKADYKSIDSSLWFIIGHYVYKKRYHDTSLFNKSKSKIKKALTWLSYQDMNEDSILEQLPTTDWQDAFPHRYGATINTQALYYFVLNLTNQKQKANQLKKIANKDKEDGLWNGSFYLPWRWKNHNKYKELGTWFDSLGNILAILFGLATPEQTKKILAHVKKENIAEPYPMKAIYPPIRPGTKDWQDYFKDAAARKPYDYLNAGIWTYIGGFYVLALIKNKKFYEARKQLNLLAKANLQEPKFSEWLNGKTGKPGTKKKIGGNQGWNAGMYILAYESLKKKKVLL